MSKYDLWLSTLNQLELIALGTGLVFVFLIFVIGLFYSTTVTLSMDDPTPGYDCDDDWGTGTPPSVPPEYVEKGL